MSGITYCFCGAGGDRSWEKTAVNSMTVSQVEIEANLGCSSIGCPFPCSTYTANIEIRVNGTAVANYSPEVNPSYYFTYKQLINANFDLNEGDIITYNFSYSGGLACIRTAKITLY